MLFFLPLAAALAARDGAGPRAAAVLAGAALLVDRAVDGAQPARLRSLRADRVRGRRDVLDRQPSARASAKATSPPTRDLKRAELAFRAAHPGLTAEAARAALLPRGASATSRAHPGWWLGLLARKAFYTWSRSARRMRYTRPSIASASIVPYLLLLPFALAGVAARRGAGRAARRRCSCSPARRCSSASMFFPQERFRIPVIDPTLIVCAAGAGGPAALVSIAPRRPRRRPDLQRARQPARARARACSRTTASACWSSTTGRRTAPARSPTRWPREYPGRVEVMHRTGPRGLGRSYIDGLRARDRADRRRSRSARWTPTCRTTPSTCRRSPPRPPTTTSSSARAT